MFKANFFRAFILCLLVWTCIGPAACRQVTPPPPSTTYTQYQLEYKLLANFPDFFWCDPDYYPIARPGIEEQNSIEQFPTIRANAAEFSAILEQLKLQDKPDFTDAEKLQIYKEHKKLTRIIQMTPSGIDFSFDLRVREGQGERITGVISANGKIDVQKREVSFNTCPICLVKGTLIDTPLGLIPVEQLRDGMPVWTFDASSNIVEGVISKTTKTEVPVNFEVVQVTLSDGRNVTASPGHPTADFKGLGEYKTGDNLDGAIVVSVERIAYNRDATYDILPSGATGLYRANGVLLKSTLWGD